MFEGDVEEGELLLSEGIGFGFLSDLEVCVFWCGFEYVQIILEICEFLKNLEFLIIVKVNVKSIVYWWVYMDYVGVKFYDDDGKMVGEFRIVGMFVLMVYMEFISMILFLCCKVVSVLVWVGYDLESYFGCVLKNVLEVYFCDELFQIDNDFFYVFFIVILQLDEWFCICVLVCLDKFDCYVFILVFIFRDRYMIEVCFNVGIYLVLVYEGCLLVWYVIYLEGLLVWVYYIIGCDKGEIF